jgi:type I restriction enzyme S subunit
MVQDNNIPQGYKQTELGIIPEDWEVKQISDFTSVVTGGTPSTQHAEYWGGDIRWMNSGELNLKFVYDVEGRITEEGLNNSSTHIIPAKCVLVGLAGQGKTRGTAAYNLVSLCTNQSIAAFLPTDTHSSLYLYYVIDSLYDYLRLLSSGDGGRGGLNKQILSSLNIVLPPIAEQRAIAETLSDVDGLIAALDKKIAKKRLLKQGAMQQLLTGKKRLPGFTDEWVEKTLGEIGTLSMCKRIFQEETSDSGDVPFYKIGTFGQEADAFISKAKYESYKNMYRFPSKGDILISAAGTIGRTVVYDGKPAYFQDSNIIWLAHTQKHILNIYLSYVYQIINWNIENTTIARLYNDNFNNTVVLFPKSLVEQQAIATILSDMDKEIADLEAQRDKYRLLKSGMMQKLLTGQIRLKTK